MANGGIVREGDALNRHFTQFPDIQESQVNEMNGGSYQARLAREYATAVREKEVLQQGAAFQDIDMFHQTREVGMQSLPCSYFDQVNCVTDFDS